MKQWHPNCTHAEHRGRLAPLVCEFHRCPVRAKDVYNESDCAACPNRNPLPPKPQEEEETMPPRRGFDWDGPARAVIPDAAEHLKLWAWAEEVGPKEAATQLDCAQSTVSSAITTRTKRQPSARTKNVPKTDSARSSEPAASVDSAGSPVVQLLTEAPTPAPGLTVEGLLAFIGELETHGRDPVEFCRGFEARARMGG